MGKVQRAVDELQRAGGKAYKLVMGPDEDPAIMLEAHQIGLRVQIRRDCPPGQAYVTPIGLGDAC